MILIVQFFLRYLSGGLAMMMSPELSVDLVEDSPATVLEEWEQPWAVSVVEPWVKEL